MYPLVVWCQTNVDMLFENTWDREEVKGHLKAFATPRDPLGLRLSAACLSSTENDSLSPGDPGSRLGSRELDSL